MCEVTTTKFWTMVALGKMAVIGGFFIFGGLIIVSCGMITVYVFRKWVNLDVLAVATLRYWKPAPNHPGNAPFGTYFEKCFPKTQNQIMTV